MKQKRQIEYRASRLMEPPDTGTAYYLGARLSSVVLGDKTIKSLDGWDQNEDLARECLDIWRSRGFDGAPASPASFFREEMGRHCAEFGYDTRAVPGANNLLSSHTRGGWIEARKRGACIGSFYHYDVNTAYYWASLQGLPMKLKPYEKGDQNYVVLMRGVRSRSRELPNVLERGEVVLVTSEDVHYYDIEGTVIDGVSFSDSTFQASDVIASLHYLPAKALKRVQQSFWGTFAAREPLTVVRYQAGQEVRRWHLPSPNRNTVWANLIVRRVMSRIHASMETGGVLCFVDSVLTPHRLSTGTAPGDWKLVQDFPEGVFVHCAGVWDCFARARKRHYSEWYRHAGYAPDPRAVYAKETGHRASVYKSKLEDFLNT